MVKDYLNQTATLKTTTGYDGYGDPITVEKSIPVRWEGKRRLVRDSQGREVISEARFFCLEKVKPDDIAEYNGEEWKVIAISERVDLDGNLSHYEVAV
jgi:hypothetical protein